MSAHFVPKHKIQTLSHQKWRDFIPPLLSPSPLPSSFYNQLPCHAFPSVPPFTISFSLPTFPAPVLSARQTVAHFYFQTHHPSSFLSIQNSSLAPLSLLRHSPSPSSPFKRLPRLSLSVSVALLFPSLQLPILLWPCPPGDTKDLSAFNRLYVTHTSLQDKDAHTHTHTHTHTHISSSSAQSPGQAHSLTNC